MQEPQRISIRDSEEVALDAMSTKLRLGISTCLLGEKVRYDGGHSSDLYLTNTLGRHVAYIPVCPEVECGFSIPREPLHLTGDPAFPRLVTRRTKQDKTTRMVRWARQRVKELEGENLCGFIFKSHSPSCGMEHVKVYDANGIPGKTGIGIFAGILRRHFHLLPVVEEARLQDPVLRENFIERIFVFKRWLETLSKGRRKGHLVKFHSQHKLLILAHSPRHYCDMGRLVARSKEIPVEDLYASYQVVLMQALSLRTTVRKNANVLHRLMGYFKKQLSQDERQELLEIIQQYCQGYVPLIVPITLINHYVRKYDQPYLQGQYYLHPHPIELQLRNHV